MVLPLSCFSLFFSSYFWKSNNELFILCNHIIGIISLPVTCGVKIWCQCSFFNSMFDITGKEVENYNKRSHPDGFCKKCGLKIFAKFIGKQLCLFFNNVPASDQQLQFCKIFNNTFYYRTPPVATSVSNSVRYVTTWDLHFINCLLLNTAQKMKFSIKDFFSKCDKIRSFLWIWSHFLKKSIMGNYIFCAVQILNI